MLVKVERVGQPTSVRVVERIQALGVRASRLESEIACEKLDTHQYRMEKISATKANFASLITLTSVAAPVSAGQETPAPCALPLLVPHERAPVPAAPRAEPLLAAPATRGAEHTHTRASKMKND